MSGDVPQRLVETAAEAWAHGITRAEPMAAGFRRVIVATFAAATADDLEALAPAAVAEVWARALREAAERTSNALSGHPRQGRNTRAWWAVSHLRTLAERAEAEGGDR